MCIVPYFHLCGIAVLRRTFSLWEARLGLAWLGAPARMAEDGVIGWIMRRICSPYILTSFLVGNFGSIYTCQSAHILASSMDHGDMDHGGMDMGHMCNMNVRYFIPFKSSLKLIHMIDAVHLGYYESMHHLPLVACHFDVHSPHLPRRCCNPHSWI